MKHITMQTLPMILLIGIIYTISPQAATYTVNDTNDAGDGTCDATCTLRDAVDDANGTADDDIIEFASPLFDTSQTITLLSGELVINNNGTLIINGTGADKLAVSGNNASRVFLINSNANSTLDGLTIRDGLTQNGAGGGMSNQGVLTIKNSVITNNDARPNGGTGGGILNGAGRSLTITNSTVSNNFARNGGGITNDSQALLIVTNVTISGNTATSIGGGLYNNSGTANLTNSTISGNSTQFGGGLYQQTGTVNLTNITISNNSAQLGGGIINDGTTNLTNTIIANSTSGGECENYGTINATHSLIENAFVCVNGNNSNYLMDDPLLAPLGNYGGPTQTHALLPGSPAIDTADPNNFPTNDQRGVMRPIDGDSDLTATPDIGSFEFGVEFFKVTKTADTNDGTCDSDCSLREAFTAANVASTNDIINFDAGVFATPQTITLTNGELVVSNNGTLTINGTGANRLFISGNNASRVFNFNSVQNVILNDLTITGGSADNGGGIYSFQTPVTINRCAVINNSTTGIAGGIYNINATMNVNNSTISGNSAGDIGGGLANGGAPSILNITNSTISGNVSNGLGGGGIFTSGELTVRSSTITTNHANGDGVNTGLGGGISNFTTEAVSLGNTIVADNLAPTAPDFRDTLDSQGFNLIGDTSGTSITGDTTGNILNQSVLLAPLNDYGGPTKTHALLPGSPAINAADPNNFPPKDQRGIDRPADGNALARNMNDETNVVIALLPDIGAFEALAPTAADATISGKVLSPTGRGVPRATVHVTDQNGDVRTARTNSFGYYRFEDIEVGQTLVFNVYSKQYQYDIQVINFEDALTKFDFFPQAGADRKSSDEKRE